MIIMMTIVIIIIIIIIIVIIIIKIIVVKIIILLKLVNWVAVQIFYWLLNDGCTAQKMKFSIKSFFSKYEQIN